MSVKRILRRIRLDKIAAVDSPCQEHATIAIIKRAPVEGEDAAALRKAVDVAVAAEIAKNAKATPAEIAAIIEKVIEDSLGPKGEAVMKITSKTALRAEIAKFDPEVSPASHVAIIKSAATVLKAEDELPTEGPLAIEKSTQDPELAKALTEIAILKLAPEARTHYDGLDAAGQTAFLAKSADEQKADIAKSTGDDPVVYTTKGGIEVRKSAGAAMIALAKSNDDLSARVEKAESNGDAATFAKRAGTEFPHVAEGTVVAMLKSAQTLGVETDAGKDVLKSLKAMNDGSKGLFKREGSSGSEAAAPAESIAKARQSFASKVDAIAKRDSITKAEAMDVAEVEEPALFAEAYPETEAAEADAE